MRARAADFYGAYDTALNEIDNAIALNPNSVRYQYSKGLILRHKGKYFDDDQWIDKARDQTIHALEMYKIAPAHFYIESDFYIAIGFGELGKNVPDYQAVIDNYQKAISLGASNRNIAWAWGNMSIAYRNLGLCQEAKEAAEKALSIMNYGNARNQKIYAEVCLAAGAVAGH